jgi:hypothetical protein
MPTAAIPLITAGLGFAGNLLGGGKGGGGQQQGASPMPQMQPLQSPHPLQSLINGMPPSGMGASQGMIQDPTSQIAGSQPGETDWANLYRQLMSGQYGQGPQR